MSNKEANENVNLVRASISTTILEEHDVKKQHIGSIGTFDFITWTIISAIGILFCLIHTEQERIWHWTGPTLKDAQSLQAKVIVSIISTVIGGSFVAVLIKTTVALSYTLARYQGARFSQLIAMIGGYQPSHIPILTAGGAWFSIILIVLILIASAVTKQLAVVSMGVSLITTNETLLSYTPDYTMCESSVRSMRLERSSALLGMDVINSIRNPNHTYTNEFYDRGIPASLKGNSSFQRVLPYGNVSCIVFNSTANYNDITPNVTSISPSAWSTIVTVALHDEDPTIRQWVNCIISLGYAAANTTCNNTLYQTTRTSSITPYPGAGPGVTPFLSMLFNMMTPVDTFARGPLVAWILGGNITDYYDAYTLIPGESLQVIQNRMNILSTITARVLCDFNYHDERNSTIPITSLYQSSAYYMYHVLWKWPFWLIAGLIFLLWMICMITLRKVPETRVMSIEWLLSQYLNRHRWNYLSGRQLVQIHQDSIFHIKEGDNTDGQAENIIISKTGPHKDTASVRIRHNKQYL